MTTIKTQPYLGQRVAATVIDYFIIFVFFFAFVFVFGEPNENGEQVVSGPLAVIPAVFWFCWLIIPETLWGKTAGHHATGLKIITLEGNKPLFWQAMVRRLFDFIDMLICFPGLIALILVLKSKYHQRLGDMVAKTLVIDKNFELGDSTFDFEKSYQNQ